MASENENSCAAEVAQFTDIMQGYEYFCFVYESEAVMSSSASAESSLAGASSSTPYGNGAGSDSSVGVAGSTSYVSAAGQGSGVYSSYCSNTRQW